MKLNEVIYENRKKQKLTQEQLAEKLNLSNKTISKWERGLSYPDILIVPLLCEVLDIDINTFYNTEELKKEVVNEKYDYNFIRKSNNLLTISISLLALAFLPFFGLVFQGKLLLFILISLGIIGFFIGIVIFIINISDIRYLIKNNYYNEIYIRLIVKNILVFNLSLYFVISFFLFLSSTTNLNILFLILYLIFIGVLVITKIKYKIPYKLKDKIFYIIISFVFFTLFIVMFLNKGTILSPLLYFMPLLISQTSNYISILNYVKKE